MSEQQSCYVLIHGRMPHTSKTLVDYIDHIIYGAPEKITATEVNGNFVALVEYPDDQLRWATGTFDRMASFSFGAMIPFQRITALEQFGVWVYHYATSKTFEVEAA